ncbi:hypothetical protein [Novipirellula caenicola]|uniref:DUF4424 domain-containing protein n=1 Tax=Novipirellula caenicola TaxID=1536901 RepID=A0ABP9W306_9BACT
MRLMIALFVVAIAISSARSQESPLAKPTVTSTRLSCSTGFAEVTYGYKRSAANADAVKLEFIVIQTSQHHLFKTEVFLSSKVDDVTPPAYITFGDGVIDLPNDAQLHAITDGRYHRADSDVTLGEIRAWVDQSPLRASIESLLEYRTKSRADEQGGANKRTRWVQASPEEVVWSSKGSDNVLDDHSIELRGSSNDWQEFTLYFQPPKLMQIEHILLEVLPSAATDANDNQRMVLFEVNPHLESVENGAMPLEFRSCRFLGNEDDETAANCIDSLSDTGWTVPDFVGKDACHQLVMELRKPITVQPDGMFAITIDSGGAPDLRQLSRIRVSFSGQAQDGGW